MKEKRYEELKKLVTKYNYQYHELGESEISDFEFDMLNMELRQMEKENPNLVTPNSPTQIVGAGKKRVAGIEVTHNVPMLSINDVFSNEDVISWVRMVKKVHPDARFSVEQKIDGLSMTLRYENGVLKLAETRGDGYIGEDITDNALVIPNVCSVINTDIPYLEIRGEVYMLHEDFEKYNQLQEENGKKLAANARNLAVGTLRQLDPEIVKERGLRMFIFNVQDGPDNLKELHSVGLQKLDNLGITTIPRKICTTEEEILAEIDRIGAERENLDYDIDGAVVKIEQIAYRNDFSVSSKYSSGHIAYKYPPEEKETTLLDVDLAVGKTGKITVTGVLKPIHLCGTTVQRVTLHNQDFIIDNEVGIGGTYLIYKSGEIIPKLKGVVKKPEKIFMIPDRCPVCGEPVIREEGMSDIKCVNPLCPAQLSSTISYFVSREAMNIKALGDTIIQSLIDEGYLSSYVDIYSLKNVRSELIEKGIMGKEKNTDKILATIEESKSNEPERLLTGLSIPNVGKSTAKELMKHFNSIQELTLATVDELQSFDDIGEITAKGIVDFFANEKNILILNKFILSDVNMEKEQSALDSEIFKGKTFCITGSLPTLSRKEMETLIESNGGKISGSVSKKTDYLIAGEKAGSKLDKANSLGVIVLKEADIREML